MEGVVVTDAVSWAERDEARDELRRAGATTIDERDDGMIVAFADADAALAAAVELRGLGLWRASRVAVAEGPVDAMPPGAADAALDGPAVRRALALVRLGRSGVLLAPAALADRCALLPEPNERWFLTLSDLVGPEPIVALLPETTAVLTGVEFPLPAPIRAAASSPFVGRDDELAALRDRWAAAAAGRRAAIALRANSGMGKTRLAAALAEEVHTGGALVLASHFDPGGAPHRPFADALRFYVERRGAAALRDVLGASAAELARLVPDFEGALGAPRPVLADADLERHRLFDAVDAWLASASAPAGLLLVLDDVHLASPETVALLAHLARSSRPARLLLLLLCRDDEASAGWEELERLVDGGVEITSLRALEPDEVADLAAAHSPAVEPVARRLSAQVAAVTAGNPLYVVQLAHHLAESGLGPARAAAGEDLLDAVGLPRSVSELLERRLELLGDVGLDVLSRAAIVGDPVDLDVLDAVVDVDLDEDTVAEIIEQGRLRGLLHDVEPRRVGFTHGLVRAAFADRMGATRKARLHARIADALLARLGPHDERVGEVARHLIAAGATDSRMFDIARRAGGQALARVAYSEAASMFAGARDALPNDADAALRDEVDLDLAVAQHLAGRAAAVDAIVAVGRRAAARGDEPTLVRAALACGRGFFGRLAGIDDARVGLIETALAMHAEADATRARLLARLATEISFGPRAADRHVLVDEALAIARRVGSSDVLVDALIAAQHTQHETDRLSARLAMTAELLAAADADGDPVQRTRARWFRADALVEAGELDRAAVIVDEAIELADQVGQPLLEWATRILRTGALCSRAALAEARDEAYAAYELGMRVGQPDAVLFFGGHNYSLRYENDRLASIAPQFRPFADVDGAPPVIVAMQALIDCELDDEDAARARLDALAAAGFDHLPRDDFRLSTLALAGEVARRLGDRDIAARVDAELEPDTGALVVNVGGAIGVTGAVTHHRGLLRLAIGDIDGGLALLEQALARHEQIGAPAWLNRTRVELARAIADRDPERARALATRAAAESERLGLVAINTSASQVLAEM